MKRVHRFLWLMLLGISSAAPALAMPEFVPKPGDVYDDFTALEQPRTDVPVGALWVEGYGPTGQAASAENIETVKSLSGVTISRDLELRILAGILNLFGVDPSYKDRLSVRLGDLTIVRVKDLSKLSGPAGEPRIYEALKAGTITITTENDISLDLETRVFGQRLPVTGRSDNGRRRSFTIDGRDMFLSFRVVTPKVVRSKAVSISFVKPKPVSLGGYKVVLDSTDLGVCLKRAVEQDQADACRSEALLDLHVSRESAADDRVNHTKTEKVSATGLGGEAVTVTLPVPVSDGQGGLFLVLRMKSAAVGGEAGATKDPLAGHGANLWLEGTRLSTLRDPTFKGW